MRRSKKKAEAPSRTPARWPPLSMVLVLGLGGLLQDEGNRHVGPVADDVAILDHDVHVFYPTPLHAPQRLVSTGDGLIDGVLEAFVGDGAHFDDARDAHMRVCLPNP